MDFLSEMHAYFRGEKVEALYFILPLGIVLFLFGIVALKAERGTYAWGMAVPCFAFGLLLAVTGATVALRTSAQVAGIEKSYAETPVKMAQGEIPRMQKVMKDFRTYLLMFLGFAVIGVGLRFAVPFEWAKAAGPIFVLAAGLGLVIDGFAERRAHPYIAALEAVADGVPETGDTP